MKKVFIPLLLVLLTTPVHAVVYHFYSAEDLMEAALEWEKSQTNPKDADLLLVSSYAGYIGALFDHLSEKQHICAPDGLTKNDVIGLVSNYLKNNRKYLNSAGSVLVEKAFYKEYSCAK